MSSTKESWIVSEKAFSITTWTLCGIALLFLASRFALRVSTKRKLMGNDYFLVAAVPFLLAGVSILQSVLPQLYNLERTLTDDINIESSARAHLSRGLGAAIELMWITIYCVKFCYFAQFKFYKPPYAYVDQALTIYYWIAVGISSAGFLFAIVQPIILCPTPGRCRYISGPNTRPWEIATTTVDILTDILVVSIPMSLINMANTIRSYTIVNFIFKSLSTFNIVIAAARLALQYDTTADRVRYVSVIFLLGIEATMALTMVSISSYRVVVLDYLARKQRRSAAQSTHLTVRQPPAIADGGDEDHANGAKVDVQQDGSLSEIPFFPST